MFLRQALEARLVALFVEQKQYTAGLSIASHLLKELKKIDDKALLVEVSVTKWYFGLMSHLMVSPLFFSFFFCSPSCSLSPVATHHRPSSFSPGP